jgi:type II secretory pathway component GspD/PulD (secretin)
MCTTQVQRSGVLLCGLVLCLTSSLRAQEARSAALSLSGQVDLVRLVDLSAQRLGLRITYDDSALKGKLTLRQDKPISNTELWRLTNRVLAEQGFTTIRVGDDDTIAVTKLSSAPQFARVETVDVSEELAAQHDPPFGPGFRRLLVPIRHVAVKDILAAIGPVLSRPSSVPGSPGAGSAADSDQAGFIVLADLVPNLDAALRIIQQIDRPDGGSQVRLFQAKNTDAARLVNIVKQIADKRKSAGARDLRGEVLPAPGSTSSVMIIAPGLAMQQWEDLLSQCDQREEAERRTYSTGSFPLRDVATLIEQTVRAPSGPSPGSTSGAASDDRWRIVLDDLTGTLVITASPTQHDQIDGLLKRLAAIPPESRRPVRTFKIRNRTVRDVQQVVEELLRSGVLEAQADVDVHAAEAGPGPLATSAQMSPRTVIPIGPSPSEPAAPSALSPPARGNGRSGARSGGNPALTLTSDEATNSLIAVGEPRLLAQLEKLLPTLDVRQPQVMLEAILVSLSDTQSLNFGVELEHLRISGDTMIRLSSLFGLSTAAAGAAGASRSVGDGAGFTGTVLDPGDFAVVVRALKTVNAGRSLSHPKILVSNNQQATFNSVLQQPFATTNASTTVATTSFGGTQDAGTTISVKPQIAEGDHLVLTYAVSLSSFVGSPSSANVPPPRQQNSVQSVATIPDDYTVVVGGLELNTDGNDVSQVPLIGDIPILGEVFKNRTRAVGRQRFFVFLHASVLRDTNLEDLKYLSDSDAAAAKIDDGWPEVTPRVIR